MCSAITVRSSIAAWRCSRPAGRLVFSNNAQKFKLDARSWRAVQSHRHFARHAAEGFRAQSAHSPVLRIGEAIMIKKGSAAWKGSLKEGTGTISTETGVLQERALWIQGALRRRARARIPKNSSARRTRPVSPWRCRRAWARQDSPPTPSRPRRRCGSKSRRWIRHHAQRSGVRGEGARHRRPTFRKSPSRPSPAARCRRC